MSTSVPPDRPPAAAPATPPSGSAGRPQSVDERAAAFLAVRDSAEFQELRGKHRRFVMPVIAAALVWYFSYVLLAAYAPGFMGRQVAGNFNVGVVFGLLQFVSTFAVTALYVRWSRTQLDPASEKIRADMEAGGLR